jgi:hypothetical protein
LPDSRWLTEWALGTFRYSWIPCWFLTKLTKHMKDPNMVKYLQKAREIMTNFVSWEVFYVPRSQNKKADALSKLASVSFSHLAKEIRVEVLQSSTTESEEICTIQFGNDSWMGPIHAYLSTGHLPKNREKARRVQTQAL